MRVVVELRSPGGPQEHLDRVTFRSAGEQSRQYGGAERCRGKPADPESLRDVIGDDHLEHVTRGRVGRDDEVERPVGAPRLSRYLSCMGVKVRCDMATATS